MTRPPTQNYLLRFLLTLLLGFSAACMAQPAEEPAAEDAQGAPATAEAVATPEAPVEPEPPSLEEQIATVGTAIEEVDAQLLALEGQPAEEGEPPDPHQEFLQQKKLLLERYRSALVRNQQLESQLQTDELAGTTESEGAADPEGAAESMEPTEPAVSQQADDLPVAPAPTIHEFDVLLDQHEAAERQLAVAAGSVEAQEAAVERAEERLDAASSARRAVEETQAGADKLDPARWEEALAELRVRLANAQFQAAALELELAEKNEAHIEEQVERARANVVFTPEALDKQVSWLEDQREELNKQLADLYSRLEKRQQAVERAQAELAASPAENQALAEERLATAERELRATRQAEQYAQQRLENLVVEQNAWKRRFVLYQPGTPDDLRQLLTESAAQLDDIRTDAAAVGPEFRNMFSSALELQQRLEDTGLDAALRPVLRARLDALQDHMDFARDYLGALARQENLLARLVNSLQARIESEGVHRVIAEFRDGARAAWNYELFTYEDKAYRVASLTYALLTFIIVLVILLLLRKTLRRWWTGMLRHSDGRRSGAVRDLGFTIINNTSALALAIVAFWAASWFLPLEWLAERRSGIFTVAIYIQLAIYATNWMSRSLNRTKARMLKEDPSSVTAYGLMSFFGRLVIWIVFFLLALMAMDFEITPLIAGLGVGGIAVAFALQNILADVFNSVAIVLDKPFVVGDFIGVGDISGVVESIGIKTTRLRALSGEQISVSNSDLLGSRIHNYKRMEERRVVLTIGVTYQTPLEKVRAIPGILREAVEAQSDTRFDRAHFATYGDFSLNFECVYYVLTSDYTLFMDIQQAINLILYERFEQESIEFAIPTQVLYVERKGGEGEGVGAAD